MKLYLCCLMVSAQAPDVFIVDEPTNNIDILSMEILTETLKMCIRDSITGWGQYD